MSERHEHHPRTPEAASLGMLDMLLLVDAILQIDQGDLPLCVPNKAKN